MKRRLIGSSAPFWLGLAACPGPWVEEPPPDPPFEPGAARTLGSALVRNDSREVQHVEIAELAPDATLDCERVGDDPAAYLDARLFSWESAPLWIVPLFPGESLAVDPSEWTNNRWSAPRHNARCRAFLVRLEGLPEIVAFYEPGALSALPYDHTPSPGGGGDPAQQPTLVVRGDYAEADAPRGGAPPSCPVDEDPWIREVEWAPGCALLGDEPLAQAARRPEGARYAWDMERGGEAIFSPRAPFDPGSARAEPDQCGPRAGLAWEQALGSTWGEPVTHVSHSADGCHTLLFGESQETSWTTCGLPKEATLVLDDWARRNVRLTLEDDLNWYVVEPQRIETGLAPSRIEARRSLAESIPREIQESIGCAPRVLSCGAAWEPLSVPNRSYGSDQWSAEPLTPRGARGTEARTWIVRAERLLVGRDQAACDEERDALVRPQNRTSGALYYVETVRVLAAAQ